MSIASVITRGYGFGVSFIPPRGYIVGTISSLPAGGLRDPRVRRKKFARETIEEQIDDVIPVIQEDKEIFDEDNLARELLTNYVFSAKTLEAKRKQEEDEEESFLMLFH